MSFGLESVTASDPDPRARRRVRRRRRRRGLRGRIAAWLAWMVTGTVLVTVAVVGVLRFVPPPTTAFILRARVDAALAGRHLVIRHRWVDWNAISPEVRIAAVAGEDQRFPWHYGFDFHSIQEAIDAARAGDRLRGASTISQQTAKNLFLWPARSYVRKAIEAYFTVLLEALWSKRRILEVYLNVAQFGDGVYGVEAASRAFFDEPAADLTAEQAALLAAVLPNPERFDVAHPSDQVLARRDWILDQMRRLGGPHYLRGL